MVISLLSNTRRQRVINKLFDLIDEEIESSFFKPKSIKVSKKKTREMMYDSNRDIAHNKRKSNKNFRTSFKHLEQTDG